MIGMMLTLLVAGGACADDGLVGYWSFDEAEGDVARDMSGAGNDGTIFGATRIASPRSRALHFDGQDDYVDCDSDPSLNIAGDMTVAAWVRPETLEGRNRMLFGDASGLTIHRNYNLRFDRGDLRFEYANDQLYGVIVRPVGHIVDGAWHHIALMARRGASAAGSRAISRATLTRCGCMRGPSPRARRWSWPRRHPPGRYAWKCGRV
jgi:hypothetical protein